MSSSSVAHAHTEIRIERIVYTWSIKRFKYLPQGFGEMLSSPCFYSRNNSEKWRLDFYPRGQIESSDGIDHVALLIVRDSPEKSPIRIHVEMKVSKCDPILMNLTLKFPNGPYDRVYYQFLMRSKLLTLNSSDDDQLTISCIIDIPVEVTTPSFDAAIFDSKKGELKDDLRLLFQNPIFSDFTISVGDQKFPTHRNILARRSSVFAAMFEHEDLEENRKKEVKIEDIEPDVIKGMLEFIYTDQVTNLNELASALLEAADKYDLEQLRIMCEKTLYEGLNKENAVEILQLADFHRADTLKECVMKYIVAHAPEVFKSNDWKNAGWRPELLMELVERLSCPQGVNNDESQNSQA